MMTVIGLYLAVIANMLVSNTNSVMLPAAAADIERHGHYGLAQGVSGIIGVCAMPIYGFIGAQPGLQAVACRWLARRGRPGAPHPRHRDEHVHDHRREHLLGFGEAGVFAIGFTMIRDIYDKKQAGLYLGLVGTMMSIGILAGPFVGGLVIDQIGWRVWCFILFAFLALGSDPSFSWASR